MARQLRRHLPGGSGAPSGPRSNQSIAVPSTPRSARYSRIYGSTVPRSSPMASAPADDRLAGQHADHGPVVVPHVGALVRTHPARHPPEPEQPHHVIDPQAAGVPQRGAHQVRERRVPLGGEPLRMPGRLVPVLAALVELVRRGAHADPGDHHVLPGPGVGTARMGADGEIPDDADAHPGGPRRVLGGGQLAVRQPLQPGVKQGLAGQPGPLGRDLGRAHGAQRFRPGPPVRPVDLGQGAPEAPVVQRLALAGPGRRRTRPRRCAVIGCR